MGSTKKMMKLPIEETQIYFNDLQQVPQVHQGNIFPAIAFRVQSRTSNHKAWFRYPTSLVRRFWEM